MTCSADATGIVHRVLASKAFQTHIIVHFDSRLRRATCLRYYKCLICGKGLQWFNGVVEYQFQRSRHPKMMEIAMLPPNQGLVKKKKKGEDFHRYVSFILCYNLTIPIVISYTMIRGEGMKTKRVGAKHLSLQPIRTRLEALHCFF